MNRFRRLTHSALAALAVCVGPLGAQVAFVDFASDYELVPREGEAREAPLHVSGSVAAGTAPLSLRVVLDHATGTLADTTLALDASTNRVDFALTLALPVTRRAHRLRAYVDGALARESTGLLAGDVWVVNGQSNAIASYHPHPDDDDAFLRGFNRAGRLDYAGFPGWAPLRHAMAGQWMGRAARRVSEALDLPLAVFNQAVGGKQVGYFLPGHPDGNFEALLAQLDSAGVRGQVRGWVWSQGESDAYTTTVRDFRRQTERLLRAYRDTLGSAEAYVWQTRPQACRSWNGTPAEAQRRIAADLPWVNLLSATAAALDYDRCHHPYYGGSDGLGELLATEMLARSYGQSVTGLGRPLVDSARVTGAREATVYYTPPAGVALSVVGDLWPNFRTEGPGAQTATGGALLPDGRTVRLQFANPLDSAAGLSYYPPLDTLPAALVSPRGHGAEAFENLSLVVGDGAVSSATDAELSLATSRDSAAVGEFLFLRARLRNAGRRSLHDAVVELRWPADLYYGGRGQLPREQGFTHAGDRLLWSVPTLRPGAEVELELFGTRNAAVGPGRLAAQLLEADDYADDSQPGNLAPGAWPLEDDEASVSFTGASGEPTCNLQLAAASSGLSGDTAFLWRVVADVRDVSLAGLKLAVEPAAALRWSNAATRTFVADYDALLDAGADRLVLTARRPGGGQGCVRRVELLPPAGVARRSDLCRLAIQTTLSACGPDTLSRWRNELAATDTSLAGLTWDFQPAAAIVRADYFGGVFEVSYDSLVNWSVARGMFTGRRPVAGLSCEDTLYLTPPSACRPVAEECRLQVEVLSSACDPVDSALWRLQVRVEDVRTNDIAWEFQPADAVLGFDAATGSATVRYDTLAARGLDVLSLTLRRDLPDLACDTTLTLTPPANCAVPVVTTSSVWWVESPEVGLRLSPNPAPAGGVVRVALPQNAAPAGRFLDLIVYGLDGRVRSRQALPRQSTSTTVRMPHTPGVYILAYAGGRVRIVVE